MSIWQPRVKVWLVSSLAPVSKHFSTSRVFFHFHVDMCLSSSPQNTGNGFQLVWQGQTNYRPEQQCPELNSKQTRRYVHWHIQNSTKKTTKQNKNKKNHYYIYLYIRKLYTSMLISQIFFLKILNITVIIYN